MSTILSELREIIIRYFRYLSLTYHISFGFFCNIFVLPQKMNIHNHRFLSNATALSIHTRHDPSGLGGGRAASCRSAVDPSLTAVAASPPLRPTASATRELRRVAARAASVEAIPNYLRSRNWTPNNFNRFL